MSVYPVKISEWYQGIDDIKNTPHKELMEYLTSEDILDCDVCGAPVSWSKGYVEHSLTYGGPNGAWCSKACLSSPEKNPRD